MILAHNNRSAWATHYYVTANRPQPLAYAADNPVNNVDPTGMFDVSDCLLSFAGLVISTLGLVVSLAAEPATGGLATCGVYLSIAGIGFSSASVVSSCG